MTCTAETPVLMIRLKPQITDVMSWLKDTVLCSAAESIAEDRPPGGENY